MKKSYFLFLNAILICIGTFAQTNTFPSSGNIGIGTLSPSVGLTVDGTAIRLEDPENYPWGINIDMPADFNMEWAREFSISHGSSGKIFSIGARAVGNTLNYGYIGGNTSSDNAYLSPWMTFLPNGKIGIGTTSPSDLLTINTGTSRNGLTIISNADNALADIILKTGSGNIQSNLAGQWNISLRNDGYFSNSVLSTGLSLEFYGIKAGGGYYCPLAFTSNGNVILASNKRATSGNVLVGKTSQANSSYKLDVNGNIRANKVVVNTTGADYVFSVNYKLNKLDFLQRYIKENHHLPGIASAKKMHQDGLDVGENEIKLLAKVEELTLYTIAQNNQLVQQKNKLAIQNQRIQRQDQALHEQSISIATQDKKLAAQQKEIDELRSEVKILLWDHKKPNK